MSPTAISRAITLTVKVDDRRLPQVLGAFWRHGTDQPVADATVRIPGRPAWVNRKSKVEIIAGSGGSGTRTRFTGVIIGFRRELFPRAIQLICRGPLSLLEQEPDADIDLGRGGTGQTDVAMIAQVLDTCGVTTRFGRDLAGLDRLLGTVATDQFIWRQGMSGLAMVQEIDKIGLGYRTYDDLGGIAKRRPIFTRPRAGAALTFTEGVDIFRASSNETFLEARNRVTANGATSAVTGEAFTDTVQQANPEIVSLTGYRTLHWSSPLIEKGATAAGAGIACQEVAEWQLGEHNLVRLEAQFTTPRTDAIWPGMTIRVDADQRLGYDVNYTVVGVGGSVEGGAFRQTIDCITGVNVPASAIVSPPEAMFALVIEREIILVGGVETVIYVVQATDLSVALNATISSRAWAGGGTPPTGSAAVFTTRYTVLDGTQAITLTVTDSNGSTGTITRPLPASDSLTIRRRAFSLAGGGRAERYDSQLWRTDPPSAGSVDATANGPAWGAGAIVMLSTDELATSATEYQPFGAGVTVTSLWMETDAAVGGETTVLAGASDGRLAYTRDYGATWTVCPAAPAAAPIIRCAVLRDNPGAFVALTAAGYYFSGNSGTTWAQELAAAAGETFRDLALGNTRNMVAMAGGRLLCDVATGTAQTFPVLAPVVSDVVAVAPAINDDRCYCYDAAGRTFRTQAAGGTTMIQGADLPTPAQAQPRGLWRDGDLIDLLYFAHGSAGAYKSLDAFATAGNYLPIRQPGVAGAPAGAVYRQIGLDGGLITPPVVTGRWFAFARHGLAIRDAATGTWSQRLPGVIYEAQHLASPPGSPDVLYLVAKYDPAGNAAGQAVWSLLRSADGGATWAVRTMPPNGVYMMDCLRGSPDTVYAQNSGGLYKSTDGAQTWALIRAMGPNILGLDVFDNDTILVRQADQLTVLVTNAGVEIRHWFGGQSLGSPPAHVDPAYAAAFWLEKYSGGGNGALAWHTPENAGDFPTQPTESTIEYNPKTVGQRHNSGGSGVVIAPFNSGNIRRGTGALATPTWTTVATIASAGASGRYRMAHDYAGKLGWLMTCTESTVLVSLDDGLTWTAFSLPLSNPLSNPAQMWGVLITH